MLEDLTPEQIINIANVMQNIVFVFLFIMLLYFFAKAIPAFLQYKTIKMVEIKVVNVENHDDTNSIQKLANRYIDWRNKRKKEKEPFK